MHPAEYNVTLPSKTKGFQWTDYKLRFLLHKSRGLQKKSLNEVLAGLLPNRTSEASRKVRRLKTYKDLVKTWEEELQGARKFKGYPTRCGAFQSENGDRGEYRWIRFVLTGGSSSLGKRTVFGKLDRG